ncbi:MAG: AmiS/UreI family transporter, partial [Aerococcus urinae]
MSGITLMFSGIVLISNGLNYLDKVEDNSNALINIFTGLLYIFLNVMICVHGIFAEKDSTYYYTAIMVTPISWTLYIVSWPLASSFLLLTV